MDYEDAHVYEYANSRSCREPMKCEKQENAYVQPSHPPQAPPTLTTDVYESMMGQYRPSDNSIQSSTNQSFEKYKELNNRIKRIMMYFVFAIFIFAAFTIVGFALLQTKYACISQKLQQTTLALNDSIKMQKQLLNVTGWYIATNERIYKLHKTNVTYFQAIKICEDENSRLVTSGIRKETTRRELIDYIAHPEGYDTWIGLNDIRWEGRWFWIDNVTSSTNDTYWLEERPNNYQGNEHCGHLWKAHGYKVNDKNCEALMYALCEYVPDFA